MELAGILTNQVVVMFLLLATGMILYKIGMITDEGNRQMAGVVLYVVAPLLILDTYSMEYDATITKNMLLGFVLSAISIIIGILVSYALKIGRQVFNVFEEPLDSLGIQIGFKGI